MCGYSLFLLYKINFNYYSVTDCKADYKIVVCVLLLYWYIVQIVMKYDTQSKREILFTRRTVYIRFVIPLGRISLNLFLCLKEKMYFCVSMAGEASDHIQ